MLLNMIQGIAIGVASGLTLGGLGWIYNWISNRVRRVKEIVYLRQLLVERRTTLYTTHDVDTPVGEPGRLSKHLIRRLIYRGLHRELMAILDGRASQLSFDEKASVTKAIEPVDGILDMLKENQFPPMKLYVEMFATWEKQAWLDLPAYEGDIPTE